MPRDKSFNELKTDSLADSNQAIMVNDNKNGECSAVRDGKVCPDNKSIAIIKREIGVQDTDPEKILEKGKQKLACNSQQCVLEKVESKVSGKEKKHIRNALKAFFKIRSRGIPTSLKLMSNDDIDKFLEQLVSYATLMYGDPYYIFHECFHMIPCIFGDSHHGPTKMGKRNMVDLIKKGYKSYCVVLNTDKCTGQGIHWLCLFCDFRTSPFTIEYFNSSGNKPMVQVQRWMTIQNNNINEFKDNNGNNPYRSQLVIHSGLIHQRDSNSECGPYSLLYIMNRVKKVPAMAFRDNRITDAHVTQAVRVAGYTN